MGKIYVEGIKIYAYHGCFKEETLIGTNFLVDVELDVDLTKAAASDNLNDTVNYQTVFQVIKKEMETPSKLLEHVAERCIKSLFQQFGTIENIAIKISKLNPPLGGHIDAVAVKLVEHRIPIAIGTKITEKKCSKCDKPFGCQNLERGCWCENHQLTQEQLAYLKEHFDNCLCEECLKLFI